MPVVGIVAFCCGSRAEEEEPGPCDVQLALIVDQVRRRYGRHFRVVVAAQRAIARQLERDGFPADFAIGPEHIPFPHLGFNPNSVWLATDWRFKREGVDWLIVVANPFLQLGVMQHSLGRFGYERIVDYPIRRIGFDNTPANKQWWTRSAFGMVLWYLWVRLWRSYGY